MGGTYKDNFGFSIKADFQSKEYKCSTGTLVSAESSNEVVVWRHVGGWKIKWTRRPPDEYTAFVKPTFKPPTSQPTATAPAGPVHYDAAAMADIEDEPSVAYTTHGTKSDVTEQLRATDLALYMVESLYANGDDRARASWRREVLSADDPNSAASRIRHLNEVLLATGYFDTEEDAREIREHALDVKSGSMVAFNEAKCGWAGDEESTVDETSSGPAAQEEVDDSFADTEPSSPNHEPSDASSKDATFRTRRQDTATLRQRLTEMCGRRHVHRNP